MLGEEEEAPVHDLCRGPLVPWQHERYGVLGRGGAHLSSKLSPAPVPEEEPPSSALASVVQHPPLSSWMVCSSGTSAMMTV